MSYPLSPRNISLHDGISSSTLTLSEIKSQTSDTRQQQIIKMSQFSFPFSFIQIFHQSSISLFYPSNQIFTSSSFLDTWDTAGTQEKKWRNCSELCVELQWVRIYRVQGRFLQWCVLANRERVDNTYPSCSGTMGYIGHRAHKLDIVRNSGFIGCVKHQQ